MNRDLTETDKAYIAGFFDGEGCVRVDTVTGLQIEVTGAYKPTIEYLCKLFDSKLSNKADKRKDSYKGTYRFRLGGWKAYEFLSLIQPYLREKLAQVEIALEFMDTCIDPTGKFGEDMRRRANTRITLLKRGETSAGR